MGTRIRRNPPPRRPVGRPAPARWSGTWAVAAAVVLIAAAALVAYHTSFAGVFVFDDEFAIQRNPNMRALWPLAHAMSAPPESPVSARPVAALSLAINYALASPEWRDVMAPGAPGSAPDQAARFLANVWGYHAMNLALHVLAALALFGVVRRTLLTARLRDRFEPAAVPLAAAVALVWAVHPLTVDAVTYVTQRTEVLMGLFCLLTLYAAIRAAAPGLDPRRRRAWTVAAVVACALGMGSKQTMAVAPFIVLAWDWLFGSRTPARTNDTPQRSAADEPTVWHRITSLRWGLCAALAATWSILAAGLVFERWPHSIGIDREGWTPWTYLLTQTGVVLHYLRLSFVPAPLVLDYDGWPMARRVLDVAPQAVTVFVLLGTTIVGLARRALWALPAAWFFALLAPSSSILPLATEIAAERRMYTALMGVVAITIIGMYALVQWAADRFRWSGVMVRFVRIGGIVAVAGVASGFALVTIERNRDFASDEGLWRDVVQKRPDNPRARLNYGVLLASLRRLDEAEAQLKESLRLKEPVAKAHLNLGSILCVQQRFHEGLPHLERALAIDPELSTAHRNLGEAYAALGRRALAAQHFARAVQEEPENVFLLNRLGWLLATSPEDGVRNGAGAVTAAERAVQLTSRQDPESLDTLAAAYAEAGRFDAAVAVEREAVAAAVRRGTPDRALDFRLSLYAEGRAYREAR